MKLFFQAEERRDMFMVEVDDSANVGTVLAAIADTAGGLGREDLLLFIEDRDDALEETAAFVEADETGSRRAHAHHCRRIDVTIHYHNKIAEKAVGPGTTIDTVLKWATAQPLFEIDEAERPEFVLALCNDASDQPDKDVHLGTLTSLPACAVCFNLALSHRPQGWTRAAR
jgi:hypothetical protein